MRHRYPPILLILPIFFMLSFPASANDLEGNLSAGLGGGFGDENVGPFVVSAKYWSNTFELGSEIFYDGKTGDDNDQFALLWLAIRHYLHTEEGNMTYLGMGGANMFKRNLFENSFGYIALLGWDGNKWGFEFKFGYFDPSVYSLVAYWNF